jgi:N-acetylneuraminic acid mutarotase
MPWEGGKKVWHEGIWALDIKSGAWSEAGKLPRPLAYGVSVRWVSCLLCIGGSDAERPRAEVILLRMDQGKLILREMKELTLPVPLANAAGAITDDQEIYIACGSSEPGDRQATNRTFVFHLKDRRAGWRELPPLPAEPRILPIAAVDGKTFYLFGGAALEENDGKMVRRYLRDAWSYSKDAGWKRLADMPKSCAAAPSPAPVTGGEVLIIGGDDGSLVNFTPLEKHPGFPDSVLRYNITANTWTASGKCPAPRATVPCVPGRGEFVFPSGEVRPGVRSPEVWTLKPPPDKK